MSEIIVTQPCPDFYTVGGTLKPTARSYVARAADAQLLEAIRQRQFCYILTPRQMGKSSLMVRTANRLQEFGFRSAIIDLTGIGTALLDTETWYLGQMQRIVKQLHLRIDYFVWWQRQSHLSAVQRFADFLSEVVLREVAEPVVIFVDEIDTTLALPDSDDYFAVIRALYNERAVNPDLERLTFVLLGVASPSDLIKDPKRTPFNIGKRIQLTDFCLDEAKPLIAGLAPDPESAQQLLTRVFFWTEGHPYLTQKVCTHVAQWAQLEWNQSQVQTVVDDLIEKTFLSEAGRHTDENLQFIRDRILEAKDCIKLLQLYRQIYQGKVANDNELDPILATLKLSGLIKTTESKKLKIRNPIYKRVFDESWINTVLESRRESKLLQKPGDDESHVIPITQLSHGELFARCAAIPTDAAAWDEFFRRYQNDISSAIYRVIGFPPNGRHAHLYPDVMQIFNLRLLENERRALRAFRGDTDAEALAYLLKITASVATSALRKELRPTVPLVEDQI